MRLLGSLSKALFELVVSLLPVVHVKSQRSCGAPAMGVAGSKSTRSAIMWVVSGQLGCITSWKQCW